VSYCHFNLLPSLFLKVVFWPLMVLKIAVSEDPVCRNFVVDSLNYELNEI
jgi:hypothetical protein